MDPKLKEDTLTLEILEAINEKSDVTQRHLARKADIALGLANSYLKRCVRKGFVKITQAPTNRYVYYLTPKGFSEKSRLTAQYLSYSFSFYKKAANSCKATLGRCQQQGVRKIVLCGVSDLTEIAFVQAAEYELTVVAVYDPVTEHNSYLGLRVAHTLNECEPYDVLVMTDLNEPQSVYDRLIRKVGAERVIAPEVLGLKTKGC